MTDAHTRHLCHVEQFCRRKQRMPVKNAIVVIDQDRIQEAKAPNTFADLANLIWGMNASAAPRRQSLQGEHLDGALDQGFHSFVELDGLGLTYDETNLSSRQYL